MPSAAVVEAQDELAALGLDDGPQGSRCSSYPGIWIGNDKLDHGKISTLLGSTYRFPWGYGSEFIHRAITQLLEKLQIEQTKSRSLNDFYHNHLNP